MEVYTEQIKTVLLDRDEIDIAILMYLKSKQIITNEYSIKSIEATDSYNNIGINLCSAHTRLVIKTRVKL